MNSRSHEILGTVLSKADILCGQALWVSRYKLRKLLAEHVTVQYGRSLIRYGQDQSGVTVYFSDGSHARGAVLVGADGANSAVRSHLLPGFQAVESQYTMLHGNVILPKEMYEPVLKQSSYGILASEPGLKFYLVLEDYVGQNASFSWNCAWALSQWQADHVWSQNASTEELHRGAMEHVQHFPSYVRRAIELTGPVGMQKPPIRLLETLLSEEGLPDGLVTLVGDAAHSMVPFRGMGANTAIIDACELGRGFADAFTRGEDLMDMLRRYAQVMIPRGRQMVLESRATGDSTDASEVAGGRLK